ncbi:methyltransferase domain-containing protein [uncultured Desulfobacter sp.]|uniref:class I SAM-dependent methyltransferase n=1 Tax=uncultured Desulfobacter sp. TaxID=240139 RepID=UPI0029F5A663|nr:methyltransferase domain-containing protein [uncultured Desulfobacter sp.]
MVSELKTKKGDRGAFDENWKNRSETNYIHWTKGTPENQIQLAFRNHWNLFNEIIEGRIKGRRVLEVGCGRGSMSAYFADDGFECTLLDSSESAIETAKRIFEQNGLNAKYDVGDALKLPYDDHSFHLVFSIGLLEHFKDIYTPISEQIRILDSGGIFLGYVVPKYTDNVQKDYGWINDLLKAIVKQDSTDEDFEKTDVYRSDSGSDRYVDVLRKMPVKDIACSGVYPLPMISHSIEFPFTLLDKKCEAILVQHFQGVLEARFRNTGKNPWLCDEGFGQAFLIWCVKE